MIVITFFLKNSLKNSCSERLLGVKIDSGLNFLEQISSICKKASAKLNPPARISPYIDERKRRLIMNDFFHSQFNYCPLAWMFHSQELNIKINRLHKRCLRIVYNDSSSRFQRLLTKDNSVSIHNRKLQVLATEMFKVYMEQEPEIFYDVFPINFQPEYNLRNKTHFAIRPIRTVHYGDKYLRYLRPKLWELISSDMKDTE